VHPYTKRTGSHWRLVSLVELGVPASSRPARAAAGNVLDWIASPRHTAPVIKGFERRHASMEGNALAVSCRLGLARSPQVEYLVEVLLRCQWPDGGWNCDRNPDASHSSFHETLAPIWGLAEYHSATGDRRAQDAATRAVELLLKHHLFRSTHGGKVIDSAWRHIHWPHYWHYDYFHGLRAVARLGRLADPRAGEAIEMLIAARQPDGTWKASGRRYWRPETEAVDWGDARPMVTSAARAMLQ